MDDDYISFYDLFPLEWAEEALREIKDRIANRDAGMLPLLWHGSANEPSADE